jgi:lipid-binding SYLF domain-containing protein
MRALATWVLATLCVAAQVNVPAQAGWDATLSQRVQETIQVFKKKDPGINTFFDKAYAYAVYPNIIKGGFFVGGAHGNGQVFEHGRVIGTSGLSQGTVGLQIGGQAYSEIIFFQNRDAFTRFKNGNLKFAAQASAVAVKAGAAASADYASGVAVFTLTKKGLMAEATIGGQHFSFTPN